MGRRRVSRRHHRPRRPARLRGARFTDLADAERRLRRCRCPALVTADAGLVVVEHHHQQGCSALQDEQE